MTMKNEQSKIVTHQLGVTSILSEIFIGRSPSRVGVYRRDYVEGAPKAYFTTLLVRDNSDPEAEDKAQEFFDEYQGEHRPLARFWWDTPPEKAYGF